MPKIRPKSGENLKFCYNLAKNSKNQTKSGKNLAKNGENFAKFGKKSLSGKKILV